MTLKIFLLIFLINASAVTIKEKDSTMERKELSSIATSANDMKRKKEEENLLSPRSFSHYGPSSSSSSSSLETATLGTIIEYDSSTLFRVLAFLAVMFLTFILVWFIPYCLQLLFRNVLRWEISFDSHLYRQCLLQYYFPKGTTTTSTNSPTTYSEDEVSVFISPAWEQNRNIQLFLRTNVFQFFYMLLQLGIFFGGLALGFLIIKEDLVAVIASLGITSFIALLQISIYFSNAFAYYFALVTAYIRLGDVMDIPGTNQKGIVVEMGFIHTKFIVPSDFLLELLSQTHGNTLSINQYLTQDINGNDISTEDTRSTKQNPQQINTTESPNPLLVWNMLTKNPNSVVNSVSSQQNLSSSSFHNNNVSTLGSPILPNFILDPNHQKKTFQKQKEARKSNQKSFTTTIYTNNNDSPYKKYIHRGQTSENDFKVGTNLWTIKTFPNYNLVFNPGGNTFHNRHR